MSRRIELEENLQSHAHTKLVIEQTIVLPQKIYGWSIEEMGEQLIALAMNNRTLYFFGIEEYIIYPTQRV